VLCGWISPGKQMRNFIVKKSAKFQEVNHKTSKIGVISGHTKTVFDSRTNHEIYCNRHGYRYIFDSTPRNSNSGFDHKLHAILSLPIDDSLWWFWLDDDAFFMQIDKPLEDFLYEDRNEIHLIFPKSPINPIGGWTAISSGNFFFRKSEAIHDFFKEVLETDLELVRNWWNEDLLGMYTNGDQDKIVYQLEKNIHVKNATQIVPYDLFNLRPYHFVHSSDDYFLVHFAIPNQTKEESLLEFRDKWNFMDNALVHKWA
jgi:hypothetical protein